MEKIEIRPQSGPQEVFFSSPADIVIYGGAAGGGKTWALLVEPLRHITVKEFGGVIFRKTYPEITAEGALWDESMKIYPLFGSRARVGMLDHTFPSGATIGFAHMQLEQDKNRWQGSQIAYIGFDELTHFSEGQFFYMLSRNRSTCGVRPYVRATCNPDPESWVARFISWWIDVDTGYPITERGGVVRWFIRVGNEFVWGDTPDSFPDYPGQRPKSMTFIPASVYDNQVLLQSNPDYLSNLMSLSFIDRTQLLDGNWKVRAGAGKIFNREWFEVVTEIPSIPESGTIHLFPTSTPPVPSVAAIVPAVSNRSYHRRDVFLDAPARPPRPKVSPPNVVECRFFDFAATKPSKVNRDPDFTASVKIRRVGNMYYIVDVQAGKWSPTEVDREFVRICKEDARQSQETGIPLRIRWEIEPGSAGIRESSRLVSALAGLDAKGVRPGTGEKSTRWKPFAVQCEHGFVKVLRAPWTESFLIHLHHQPESSHDDVCDAASGSFLDLANVNSMVGASGHHG